MSMTQRFVEIQMYVKEMQERNVKRDDFEARILKLRSLGKPKLVREQYAQNEFIDYLVHEHNKGMLFVYKFGGDFYCTTKTDIPELGSTDTLHEMGLDSAVWDAMGILIFYSTGNLYEVRRKENTELTHKVLVSLRNK